MFCISEHISDKSETHSRALSLLLETNGNIIQHTTQIFLGSYHGENIVGQTAGILDAILHEIEDEGRISYFCNWNMNVCDE
jgi:hypothetical protein